MSALFTYVYIEINNLSNYKTEHCKTLLACLVKKAVNPLINHPGYMFSFLINL